MARVTARVTARVAPKHTYPGVLQCLQCGFVLVSNYGHDFQECACPNATFIDGGHDYLRYGGKSMEKIQILKLSKAKTR